MKFQVQIVNHQGQLKKILISGQSQIVFLDQTYCQNQDNSQRCYTKKGTKNTKKQPTTRLSLNAIGVQAINGNSFISFLDNTKTFEMMKFMINNHH